MHKYNNLVLVRGLPGAGKTTFSNLIEVNDWTDVEHFETDNYWKRNGPYEFDASKLKEAHEWNQEQVENLMKGGFHLGTIVVSNTFTTEEEMRPYFELAEKYKYNVFTIIVENRHGNTSVHNVPEKTIERMKNRFEIKL